MGRARLELCEGDAHDGSPLVPSADIRLADAGCEGLLQLGRASAGWVSIRPEMSSRISIRGRIDR